MPNPVCPKIINTETIIISRLAMMSNIRVFVCFSCAMCACGDVKSDKAERAGEVYHIPGDDEAMNRATEMARKTLATFDSALKSGNTSYQKFSLKSKFDTPDGAEHVWVKDISIKKERYFGVVDNVPNSI